MKVAAGARFGPVLACMLCGVVLSLGACRTGPVPAVPAVHPADIWTTPPDASARAAPRLVRPDAPPWPAAPAPAPDISVDAELVLLSRYVWRGQLLTDDPVLEPAVSLGYEGFSLAVWGNVDLTDVNGNELEFNEVDLTLEYGRVIHAESLCLRVFGGAALYLFPNTGLPATLELYAGMGVGVPLSPSITVYRDVDEIDGTYLSLDVDHTFALPLGGLVLAGGVGWGSSGYNRGYFGVNATGLNDLHLLAAWALESGRWTVKPSVAFSSLLDGDIRAAVGKNDLWIFGITVSLSL